MRDRELLWELWEGGGGEVRLWIGGLGLQNAEAEGWVEVATLI